MPWTVATTPPAWNVTDIELIERMQYLLLENGNADATGQAPLLTTMFSFQQLIDALNLAQREFMRDTGCVMARATQGSTPQVARYTLPSDWIFTRRLTWQANAGQIKSLARTDTYELDHELLDWQQNFDTPVVYNDGSDLPTLTVEIAKAPAQIGAMELDYVAQPVTLPGLATATRIQSSGGSSVLKYFRDLGLTVNGDSYQVSALVKNQGPTAVTVASNISGSATVQPSTTQQVSFSYTGNGVTDQQMRFSTANISDAMDIIAVNPIMQHNNGPNLLSGADLTFAGGWAGFGGNTIVLTQSQTIPLINSLTIPDECESAVLYGALAQLFGQDGEGHDADRAAYCRERYTLAVELTNALTGGGPERE